jgi:enamine deaminase RidA (YjgF/YER057c/UK114 family)
MEKQSRRGVLKNVAAIAVGSASAATLVPQAVAQGAKPSKKAVPWNPPATAPTTPGPAPAAAPYSAIVTFGNLVFLSGVGAHFKGTIEEHTKHVLDEIEQKLTAAGSSMDKVLKVNVYLSDLANYARMNAVYAGRWGTVPPVRTTIAAAGGIPGDSLVEIDCIASI